MSLGTCNGKQRHRLEVVGYRLIETIDRPRSANDRMVVLVCLRCGQELTVNIFKPVEPHVVTNTEVPT